VEWGAGGVEVLVVLRGWWCKSELVGGCCVHSDTRYKELRNKKHSGIKL
jgi:hypothetical protein